MSKLFIQDLPIKGKKVLMRVDFNVPLDADGNVIDATRIQATIPTIEHVLRQTGSVILMSHLGRPENVYRQSLSLAPCARVLSSALNLKVKMAPDSIGFKVHEMAKNLQVKEVLLLENLRFHRGEEYPTEDPEFAKTLASYGDLYVNDAFATCHRKHSSTYYVPQLFPGKAAAGFLLEKELQFFGDNLDNPKRPLHAIIGGAKISSKLGCLKKLLEKVDALLIGGGMSYTFLKAQNIEVGDSLVEEELVPLAKEVLELAKSKKVEIVLPIDVVIAKECSNDAQTQIIDINKGIPKGYKGLDIGPKTVNLFANTLKAAKTILWNGPMGVYELTPFSHGSEGIAKALAASNAITIVGGGDTIGVLNNLEIGDKMTHVSTGGGAALEYIEHGTLPGVEALSEKPLKV